MAGGRRRLGEGAPGGGDIGPNPTDRAKNGSKKSLLTDGGGGPLSIVVAGANVHDTKLLEPTLSSVVVKRPDPLPGAPPQHLCLDKAYDNPTGDEAALRAGYIPHIRRIGEEPIAPNARKHPARRWVVERTLAWLSKCRGLLVRYEKKVANYRGLLQLACGLLWYRRLAFNSF